MNHTDTAYEFMRAYLAFVGHEQLRHEEPVGDQAHPRECEAREVGRLQRTERIADLGVSFASGHTENVTLTR